MNPYDKIGVRYIERNRTILESKNFQEPVFRVLLAQSRWGFKKPEVSWVLYSRIFSGQGRKEGSSRYSRRGRKEAMGRQRAHIWTISNFLPRLCKVQWRSPLPHSRFSDNGHFDYRFVKSVVAPQRDLKILYLGRYTWPTAQLLLCTLNAPSEALKHSS